MYEPHPVIERQAVSHFPVVLHVKLHVVVNKVAFDVLRLLQVLIEDSQLGVRKTEPAVEGVIRVIAEIHVTLRGRAEAAGAGVLRFITVVEVGPGFDGVLPPDLRQARREVVRVVDVQVAELTQARRPPLIKPPQLQFGGYRSCLPSQIGYLLAFMTRSGGVIRRIQHAPIRVQFREGTESIEATGRCVREDAAARQLVFDGAPGKLSHGRRRDRPVRGDPIVFDPGIRPVAGIVVADDAARRCHHACDLPGVLAREPQFRIQNVVAFDNAGCVVRLLTEAVVSA
jgi:hypothetical protein